MVQRHGLGRHISSQVNTGELKFSSIPLLDNDKRFSNEETA